MKGRRSTSTLTLVLIGAAALHGCGGSDNNEQASRDVYKSRADCQRDWGDDPKKCEPQSSGRHAGYFYGPMYGYGRSVSSSPSGDSTALAPRQGSNAVSSTTVSRSSGSVARGGFGSSASAHSSSSSS